MENTFIYTKEQVKEFLASKSNDAASLRRSLVRKGFDVSVKKGQFILTQELPQTLNLELILGFKPSRPTATLYIIKVLIENEFQGSYQELAETIKIKYGVELSGDVIGHAYRELVKHELALGSKQAVGIGARELRISGQALTDEDRTDFFQNIDELKEEFEDAGLTSEQANKAAWTAVKNKRGQVYSVPFKLLTFPPASVKWFREQ